MESNFLGKLKLHSRLLPGPFEEEVLDTGYFPFTESEQHQVLSMTRAWTKYLPG